MDKQELLLKIVKTWSLNQNPEYRGFRCANCQEYIKKAWYHRLKKSGYKNPIHFCNNCEKDFNTGNIQVTKPEIKINRDKFGLKFTEKIETKIREIVAKWNLNVEPIYKPFTCDNCNKEMTEAYHVWFKMDKILIEIHFCKECGDKLEINKYTL